MWISWHGRKHKILGERFTLCNWNFCPLLSDMRQWICPGESLEFLLGSQELR